MQSHLNLSKQLFSSNGAQSKQIDSRLNQAKHLLKFSNSNTDVPNEAANFFANRLGTVNSPETLNRKTAGIELTRLGKEH